MQRFNKVDQLPLRGVQLLLLFHPCRKGVLIRLHFIRVAGPDAHDPPRDRLPLNVSVHQNLLQQPVHIFIRVNFVEEYYFLVFVQNRLNLIVQILEEQVADPYLNNFVKRHNDFLLLFLFQLFDEALQREFILRTRIQLEHRFIREKKLRGRTHN